MIDEPNAPPMTHRPIVPLLAALCSALLGGCAGGPSLHYRVDLAHRDSRGVLVILDITGVPRDSLVLEGFIESSLMRIGDVVVAADGGRPLTPAVTLGSVTAANGGETGFPSVRLDGPLPSRLTLRYRVTLGAREGNAHTGFTGRCAGYAGDRFAFAAGRSLFLVPTPVARVGAIDVRFDLPVGWIARTPWGREGDASSWQRSARY